MTREFDVDRFDLLDTPRIHIADHAYGHNNVGELDVWTVTDETGTAFVRQITVHGAVSSATQGVYSLGCFFLRERPHAEQVLLRLAVHSFSVGHLCLRLKHVCSLSRL